MKKYAAFAAALSLAIVLLTGCGCSNSKPANNAPSTLPPTTGATIMPTTEATTMPTTVATTAPTTEAVTEEPTDHMTDDTAGTELPGDATAGNEARGKMPMPREK